MPQPGRSGTRTVRGRTVTAPFESWSGYRTGGRGFGTLGQDWRRGPCRGADGARTAGDTSRTRVEQYQSSTETGEGPHSTDRSRACCGGVGVSVGAGEVGDPWGRYGFRWSRATCSEVRSWRCLRAWWYPWVSASSSIAERTDGGRSSRPPRTTQGEYVYSPSRGGGVRPSCKNLPRGHLQNLAQDFTKSLKFCGRFRKLEVTTRTMSFGARGEAGLIVANRVLTFGRC